MQFWILQGIYRQEYWLLQFFPEEGVAQRLCRVWLLA